MEEPALDAVLLIGVYGSGKSSMAAEVADLLEVLDVRYAAIDLDWLAWANIDDAHGQPGHQLMLANLAPMIANFRAAGMRRFILAGSFDHRSEIESMRATLAMPLRVVRLVAPLAVIEGRLGTDPTSGRAHDLEVARADMAAGAGKGLEDLEIDNDRPLGAVAAEIVAWLGWA